MYRQKFMTISNYIHAYPEWSEVSNGTSSNTSEASHFWGTTAI